MSRLILLFLLFQSINCKLIENHSKGVPQPKPNIIVLLINNLPWDHVSFHLNSNEEKIFTPNIDSLAYKGIILNRHYSNGGYESLVTGKYKRKPTNSKENLLMEYFARDGYRTKELSKINFESFDLFKEELLNSVASGRSPFLLIADFGAKKLDVELSDVDETIGSIIFKLKRETVLNKTIVLFVTLDNRFNLPDNEHKKLEPTTPAEANVRKTAFIYSPIIKIPKRVSHQFIHISDWIPTLATAARVPLSLEERKSLDGFDQWSVLDDGDGKTRLEMFGDNFYINEGMKLVVSRFNALVNEQFDGARGLADSSSKKYLEALDASMVHQAAAKNQSNEKILMLRNRAQVHCYANEDSKPGKILCSRQKPCLFNLWQDPCEFEEVAEEHPLIIQSMMTQLDKYRRGEKVGAKDVHVLEQEEEITQEASWKIGLILFGAVFSAIFIFCVVVCNKERCKRSGKHYHRNTDYVDESGIKFSNQLGIAVISDAK